MKEGKKKRWIRIFTRTLTLFLAVFAVTWSALFIVSAAKVMLASSIFAAKSWFMYVCSWKGVFFAAQISAGIIAAAAAAIVLIYIGYLGFKYLDETYYGKKFLHIFGYGLLITAAIWGVLFAVNIGVIFFLAHFATTSSTVVLMFPVLHTLSILTSLSALKIALCVWVAVSSILTVVDLSGLTPSCLNVLLQQETISNTPANHGLFQKEHRSDSLNNNGFFGEGHKSTSFKGAGSDSADGKITYDPENPEISLVL